MRVKASYMLALSLALGGISGCGHDSSPEESGAQSLSSEDGALQISYRGEPDPPRQGDNKVHVTVARADGSKLTDAEVSVTYYMPAMPSMNMPEMSDEFALSYVANGIYEGNVRLSMAGTWQVMVAVAQTGEPLRKGRLTIIATE